MDIDDLKSNAEAEVDARRKELEELSARIHRNPELGFKEVKAAGWLTGYLEGNGFEVERGVCQLETAFRASYGSGEPRIALLAEYDALPDVGHACGHNIICTAAVGAAVALKAAVDQAGGSVVVIGTPGEEVYGGKVIMAERGAFSDIDAAMIRITNDSYGTCCDCNEPIEVQRLQAYPTATRCHECQERYEQRHIQAGHHSL